jgi:hypothetical protein
MVLEDSGYRRPMEALPAFTRTKMNAVSRSADGGLDAFKRFSGGVTGAIGAVTGLIGVGTLLAGSAVGVAAMYDRIAASAERAAEASREEAQARTESLRSQRALVTEQRAALDGAGSAAAGDRGRSAATADIDEQLSALRERVGTLRTERGEALNSRSGVFGQAWSLVRTGDAFNDQRNREIVGATRGKEIELEKGRIAELERLRDEVLANYERRQRAEARARELNRVADAEALSARRLTARGDEDGAARAAQRAAAARAEARMIAAGAAEREVEAQRAVAELEEGALRARQEERRLDRERAAALAGERQRFADIDSARRRSIRIMRLEGDELGARLGEIAERFDTAYRKIAESESLTARERAKAVEDLRRIAGLEEERARSAAAGADAEARRRALTGGSVVLGPGQYTAAFAAQATLTPAELAAGAAGPPAATEQTAKEQVAGIREANELLRQMTEALGRAPGMIGGAVLL